MKVETKTPPETPAEDTGGEGLAAAPCPATWIYRIDDGETHYFNVESGEKAIEEQAGFWGEKKEDYIKDMEPEVTRCIPGHVLSIYYEDEDDTLKKTVDEWAATSARGFLCSSIS